MALVYVYQVGYVRWKLVLILQHKMMIIERLEWCRRRLSMFRDHTRLVEMECNIWFDNILLQRLEWVHFCGQVEQNTRDWIINIFSQKWRTTTTNTSIELCRTCWLQWWSQLCDLTNAKYITCVVGYNDIFNIKIYCRSANTASYFAPLAILELQDDVDVNRYL